MSQRLLAIFSGLLRHRLATAVALVALTAAAAWSATKVRADYSVENYFPAWNETRTTYEEFRADFPRESSSAFLLVRGEELYTAESLRAIGDLEAKLEALDNVVDVQGPLSTDDITGDFGIIETVPVMSTEMTGDELAVARDEVTTDPLFRWNLAKPDGTALTIRIILHPDAAADHARRLAFYNDVQPILAAHRGPGHELTISGLPVIRARGTQMIEKDFSSLLPITAVIVIAILLIAFRSATVAIAALSTIAAAVLWTQGVQGLLGFHMSELSSIVPILIIIISLSDTYHILVDFAEQQEHAPRRPALAAALARSAGPCLVTELVIAAGFLSLAAVNIQAIVQFGVASAIAVLMAWLANMLVLPLVLSTMRKPLRRARESSGALLSRAVAWIGVQSRRRGRLVAFVAAAIVVIAGLSATQIEKRSFAFDGMRRTSDVYQDIKTLEEAHGGLVPVAIYARRSGEGENLALEPELLRSYERAAAFLRDLDSIHHAVSVSDYLRKGHGMFTAGDSELAGDGLPGSQELAAQEVELIDGDGMLADYLSFDRNSAAVVGASLDIGSHRLAEMFDEIEAFVATERSRLAAAGLTDVELHATGQLRLLREVHAILIDGLLLSFGAAVLVTLLLFAFALRSIRLALIGLVPNVAPMFLALAFMAAAGIDLKPTTVILFSIVLVIADDDTMQFLARFRRNLFGTSGDLGADERVGRAIDETLRESGRAMILTALTISAGFLVLLASEFEALAELGLLIGATLFFAVAADLFLTPLLLRRFAPALLRKPAVGEHRVAVEALDLPTSSAGAKL